MFDSLETTFSTDLTFVIADRVFFASNAMMVAPCARSHRSALGDDLPLSAADAQLLTTLTRAFAVPFKALMKCACRDPVRDAPRLLEPLRPKCSARRTGSETQLMLSSFCSSPVCLRTVLLDTRRHLQ